MIAAISAVAAGGSGGKIKNQYKNLKTVWNEIGQPLFGTIDDHLESKPDVTSEAAVLAFKANNRILLKERKRPQMCFREMLASGTRRMD